MSRGAASSALFGVLALALIAPVWAGAAAAAPARAIRPGPTLFTADQKRLNAAAAEILHDREVRAAIDAVVRRWAALPPATLPDGKPTLRRAAGELAFFAAEIAAQQTLHPETIAWILSPPFTAGVRGSRFGIDDPDRIYRAVAVDPSRSYVIEGHRNPAASNDDFRFEATAEALRTLSGLDARDIDVAVDGSFRITLDAKPSAGRRNHLTLPPGTNTVVIRDTLANWDRQLPNRLTFRQVDGPGPRGTAAQARAVAIGLIERSDRFLSGIIANVWKQPENSFTARVRTLSDGLPGYIFAQARFTLNDGEALVVTIDPQTARYTGFEVTDPWALSAPYWNGFGSRSDAQVRPNSDGSLIYIVAKRDPGYANWVSTNGLSQGFVGIRIENMPQPSTVDVEKVVRSARVVRTGEIAAALPGDTARASPEQRARELSSCLAGFRRRVTD